MMLNVCQEAKTRLKGGTELLAKSRRAKSWHRLCGTKEAHESCSGLAPILLFFKTILIYLRAFLIAFLNAFSYTKHLFFLIFLLEHFAFHALFQPRKGRRGTSDGRPGPRCTAPAARHTPKSRQSVQPEQDLIETHPQPSSTFFNLI